MKTFAAPLAIAVSLVLSGPASSAELDSLPNKGKCCVKDFRQQTSLRNRGKGHVADRPMQARARSGTLEASK